jgi:hypothetical protein
VDGAEPIRRNQVLGVGVVTFLVVLLTMAIDHLAGNEGRDDDDGLLVDPAMFAISVAASLVVGAAVFGWLVPRELAAGPERVAQSGLLCSVLSIVPGITLVWVGIPFVVAGAGLALGLEGRGGSRRIEATGALILGALALTLGTVGYLLPLV